MFTGLCAKCDVLKMYLQSIDERVKLRMRAEESVVQYAAEHNKLPTQQ